MRTIALALLIVAVRATESEQILASVEFLDNGNNTVGVINFAQDKSVPTEITVYCRLWDIPDGTYIAVVHECAPSEKYCDTIGPARIKRNQNGDLTEGSQILTLFRREWKNSPDNSFTVIAKDVSLMEDADNNIVDLVVALYRDTPTGLKRCSQPKQKTATPVAWGFVNPDLITPGGPMMPDKIEDDE